MADNLIQLEQDVETFIDPNGVAGSILAQNHQDILKSVLSKVGKYVGSPYLATKNETNLQPGLMSWRGNVMNNTNQFQIDFAKLTADLNDFGLILETLAEGDLIHFKDSKGRSVFLEYIGHTFVDGSVPIYQVFVKGKAENINYVYQENERLISVLQSYKQNSAGAIYEIQFNAPNFVLLENGVPKTSIDLSIAITETIQATETSLADFATNSANYIFQQGDVISIVTNPDNILELYLYKSGTKTDVNNYQKIDASKIDWSNILNKPENLTKIGIKDENGILQFEVIDELSFDDNFIFISATKTISFADVIVREDRFNTFEEKNQFDKGFEVGKWDGSNGGTFYTDADDGLEVYKEGNGAVANTNPKKYVYKGKNRRSNAWRILHQFMHNDEVIATFDSTHGTPYSKKLQVFGDLVIQGFSTFVNAIFNNVDLRSSRMIVPGQYGQTDTSQTVTANEVKHEIKTITRPSENWTTRLILSIVNNQGGKIEGFWITEGDKTNVINNSTEVRAVVNGYLETNGFDLSNLGSYPDDATAGSNGVQIGFAYINSSTGAMHRRLI